MPIGTTIQNIKHIKILFPDYFLEMIPDSWQSVLLLVLAYFHFLLLFETLSFFHSFFFLSLFLYFLIKLKISTFIPGHYFPGNPLSMFILYPPPPPHTHPHPLLHSQISCALHKHYTRAIIRKPMETTRCQTRWLSMAEPLSVYQPVFISILEITNILIK